MNTQKKSQSALMLSKHKPKFQETLRGKSRAREPHWGRQDAVCGSNWRGMHQVPTGLGLVGLLFIRGHGIAQVDGNTKATTYASDNSDHYSSWCQTYSDNLRFAFKGTKYLLAIGYLQKQCNSSQKCL